MGLRTNLGTGVVNVLAGDTTLFNPGAIDRYQVGSCNVYNTTSSPLTITVYISPDTTSANGDLVGTYVVNGDDDTDINSIVGQGYLTDNIIVVGSAVGLNAQLTRTEYTAGD